MEEKRELQERIEDARRELDSALEGGDSIQACYNLSLEVDRLIEEYIILEENPQPYSQKHFA